MIQQLAEPGLAERIRTAHARVAVIGLGGAGLPLATAFAPAGFTASSAAPGGWWTPAARCGVSTRPE
jgi:hypothetical protein